MQKLTDYLKAWCAILACLVIIVGLPFAALQIYQEKLAQASAAQTQTASYLLEFNNQLRNASNSYSGLISDISKGNPIISPKGNYGSVAIDNYLTMWDELYAMKTSSPINNSMNYNAFSYNVEQAYCNSEIQQFVLQARQSNQLPGEYGGFTNLARAFLIKDNNKPCNASFIDSHDEQ
jgi:hypothetical protein